MYSTRYLQFEGNGEITISKKVPLTFQNTEDLLIRSIYSGISYGTESKILFGKWPQFLPLDSTIKNMNKEVSYPLYYGYATYGEIIDTHSNKWKHLIGKKVFCFKEHGKYHIVSKDDVIFLPELSDERIGVLLPNLETAVSLVMDTAPIIGEKICVIGLGVIGQMVSSLLSIYPLEEVLGLDCRPYRCGLASDRINRTKKIFKACSIEDNSYHQDGFELLNQFDGVIEVSGSLDGLKVATRITKDSGRVIVGSFYDKDDFSNIFASTFHRSQISITSSQVSRISPLLQNRFDKTRRMNIVLKYLNELDLSNIITHSFNFDKAIEAYELLKDSNQNSCQVIIKY